MPLLASLLSGALAQPSLAQQGATQQVTLDQIAAIAADKANRTPAQEKLDSQLIYASREGRGQDAVAGAPALEADIPIQVGGLVLVDITATVSPALLVQIVAEGGLIESAFAGSNAIRALVPVEATERLAGRADVRFIQRAVPFDTDRMAASDLAPLKGARQDATSQRSWKAAAAPASSRGAVVAPVLRSPGGRSGSGRLAPVQVSQGIRVAEAARALGKQRKESVSTESTTESTEAGTVTSEGDVAHRAPEARARFGGDGTGIKIGVLSDSDDSREAAQASANLPANVTVIAGQSGRPGSGEGTAMMEIIHDLAPGAQLFFATAGGGQANFASNIRRLRQAGCDIIVDDVRYDDESPFQADEVEKAVYDVSNSGALYFSSAGNAGNKNDGTAGVWVGDFADGGASSIGTKAGRLHDFGGGVTANQCTGAGRVLFYWADPLNASSNDYDVYVVNAAGVVQRSSTTTQNGTQDPYETVTPLSVGERVVIVKTAGAADRFLYLGTFRGKLAVSTNFFQRAHNAAGAANAFSVAATDASNTAFVGGAANPVETFSSDGPRRIFYNPDGSAITGGNFSSTGGTVLQKPDITAADGVATSTPGFSPFFGTSAAAPHAAAIAGMILSYNPSLSPARVRSLMQSTALDIEAPGFDRDSGSGIVSPLLAMEAAPAPGPRLVLDSQVLAGGNGNGSADPNECLNLSVSLRNAAGSDGGAATGISAVLSTTTPGVSITQATSAYPDIAGSQTGANTTPFQVSISSDFVCGTTISLSLSVSTANAGSFTVPLQLASGVIGAPVLFESADVPKSIPDANTTGVGSTVAVSNVNGALAKVTVSLYLTHTFDADLTATLIAPDGTSVNLFTRVGSSEDDFGSSSANRTVLDDDATTAITAGIAPFAGRFRPQGTLATFRGKTGAAVNGTWTLRLVDSVAADLGILRNWAISLSPLTCADGGGACNVGPPPSASALTASTNEDTSLPFSAAFFEQGFSDPGAGRLARVRIDTLPTAVSGTLLLDGAAVRARQEIVRADLAKLSFVPAANFNGPASFNFNLSNGSSYASSGSSVSITVVPVNDAPSFTLAAAARADEDGGPQTLPVASSISAGPADEGAPGGQTVAFSVATVTSDVAPAGAALFSSPPAIGADGTLFFTSAPNASGTATLTVRATDTGGTERGGVDTSAAQTLTLTIRPVNDAPVATAQAVSVSEGGSVNFVLSGSDVEGSPLTFAVASRPRNGVLSGNAPNVTYRPRAGFAGSDSFTFTASDGAATSEPATVTLQVLAINDAPVAQGQSVGTLEDTPLAITLAASDEDSASLSFIIVAGPRSGTLTGSGAALRYTPNSDFEGSDFFTFKANDGSLDSNTAVVSITVGGSNDAPVAVADTASTPEDTEATLQVLANDSDTESDALRVVRVATTDAAHGTVTIVDDGTLRFVPEADFNGVARFTYTVSDGVLEASAVVTVQVLAVNDAPLALAQSLSTRIGTPVTITLRGSDVDGDALAFAVAAAPTNGSLSGSGSAIAYTPRPGFSGTDTFTFKANDGRADSAPATVTVQVLTDTNTPQTPTVPDPPVTAPANRAPVAQPDSYSTRGPLQVLAAVGVLANDSDADGGSISARLSSTPAHGTLRFGADGSFLYTPSVVYSGRDSFTYTASDGLSESAPATVTLQVGTPRDVTPPQVRLAGEAVQVLRRLAPARGSVADIYAANGRGIVFSSGLKSVVLQLQRGDGQYWNGRAFQSAPFNLRTRLVGRSFFALQQTLPASAPDGRYRWTAVATDNVGLVGRAQQTVVLDSTPARLLITTPAAGRDGVARLAKLAAVAGNVSEAARVRVALRNASGGYFNGRAFGAAPAFLAEAQSPGAWTLPLPTNLALPPGRYTLVVSATDAAGNIGTAQRIVEIASAPAG